MAKDDYINRTQYDFDVVLPVFNANLDYLSQQVQSIADQYSVLVRIIFVDADCRSSCEIEKIAAKIGIPFTIVTSKHNLNSYDAFESGLEFLSKEKTTLRSHYIALSDQDDIWEVQKLFKIRAKLSLNKVDLVYSDASLVDHNGNMTHGSMFRFENRHLTSSPCDMLYRNHITGMTTAFTQTLLAASLPFPRQNGLWFHHDLWLGLVASILKGVAVIKQPLVRYRQHQNNVVGTVSPRLPKLTKNVRIRIRQQISSYYVALYLAKCVYIRASELAANGLELNRNRLSELKPHLAVYGLGSRFLFDAMRLSMYLKFGQAATAFGFFAARGARLGWAASKIFTTDISLRIYEFDQRWFLKVPGIDPTAVKASEISVTRNSQTPWENYVDVRKKVKWKTLIDQERITAVQILIPTLNPTEMFAGIATAVDFGLELAALGRNVRFVATDLPIASKATSLDFVLNRIKNRKMIGDIDIVCGVSNNHLEFSKKDIFVATAWWTAHLANSLTENFLFDQKKFFYFIQDYEPNFYAWGDTHASAFYSYNFNYIPIYNTTILRDYFIEQGLENDRDAFAFHPSIILEQYSLNKVAVTKGRKRLVIYGRPEVERNMFSTCVESVSLFISQAKLSNKEIEVISVGMKHDDILLPNNVIMISHGKVPWSEYPRFLSGTDIGLSLMFSPHPSHLPLELAAAGAQVVTNSFATKDLSKISNAIISTLATPPDIAVAIERAWNKVTNGTITNEKDRTVNLGLMGFPLSLIARRVNKVMP